jgi:hypothetical protein
MFSARSPAFLRHALVDMQGISIPFFCKELMVALRFFAVNGAVFAAQSSSPKPRSSTPEYLKSFAAAIISAQLKSGQANVEKHIRIIFSLRRPTPSGNAVGRFPPGFDPLSLEYIYNIHIPVKIRPAGQNSARKRTFPLRVNAP